MGLLWLAYYGHFLSHHSIQDRSLSCRARLDRGGGRIAVMKGLKEGLTFADWESPIIKFPLECPQLVLDLY